MNPDPQQSMTVLLAFNVVLMIAGFLSAFVLNSLMKRITVLEEAKHFNDRINKLEASDVNSALAISLLREEIPTKYIRRDDFKDAIDRIFASILRIENLMHEKADKP